MSVFPDGKSAFASARRALVPAGNRLWPDHDWPEQSCNCRPCKSLLKLTFMRAWIIGVLVTLAVAALVVYGWRGRAGTHPPMRSPAVECSPPQTGGRPPPPPVAPPPRPPR